MSDLISRQKVIDAMAELQGRAYTKAELKGISKAWKRIKQLPSAQPEIEESLYRYKCFITDAEGLQHEVVHVGDLRRVTGWDI